LRLTFIVTAFILLGQPSVADTKCFPSYEYFTTENVSENILLPDFLKDESGICLDMSKAKALFCWKTAKVDIFNKEIIFPKNYYTAQPLYERFLDLRYYIKDDWNGYYQVGSDFDSLINEADDTLELEYKNTLFFLANSLGITDLIVATKNPIPSSETLVSLDPTNLTVREYHTSTLDDTELKSRSYYQCEVQKPDRLLSDHLQLRKRWGEYFIEKQKKSDF
jgi:hypothetical protein